MSLISVSQLTFAYEGSFDNIFENVSFQMDTDWKLGFTGRNGRGKTTFLNLLLGKYQYIGKISHSVDFEYFPFIVKNPTDNTIDIINEINPSYEEWQLFRELSLLDISLDVLYRPFKTLSNGEQTKVLLATLFLKENSFLLIDEPTNHLDMDGRAIVSQYLSSKKGFILVSHDRTFLDQAVDHILSINKTDIEVQKGNFSSWLLNKERSDAFEASENLKLKKDIKRLNDAAKRTSEWSDKVEASKHTPLSSGLSPDRGHIGHKAAKMMKRSKAMEVRIDSAITEKSKLMKNIEEVESLKIKQEKYHASRLLYLDKVSVLYDTKLACSDVSFEISQGDRACLIGKNGSGKSSLLKLILGDELNFTGDFQKGSGLKISYVPQDTSFLKGDLKSFAIANSLDESLFKAILRKLDFSRVQFEKNMEDFSAGQQKKVLIAKSLCESPHLHIWDEPLNYIDVLSRMQIEELLLKYSPTIIFVEHDRAFCDKIATKIIEL